MHDPAPTSSHSHYGGRHAPTEADVARTLDHFFKDPSATALPPLESPFAEKLLDVVPTDHPLRDHALRFARDGFTVIDLARPGFDELAARIVRDLAPCYPDDRDQRRIFEAWTFQPDVRALAADARVTELLRFLYQREPIPFQTLNFDLGTEYATHSDVVHFHSFPRRYMCGVWIALEDVDETNGLIHCYPGSHRLPDYDLNDLGATRGFDEWPRYEHFIAALVRVHRLERREVRVKKGHALVWAANLMHGGSPIRDPHRTRHSQVNHYFFADCAWWIPGGSDATIGQPWLREVIDVARGRFVAPRYHGKPVDLARFDRVWRYPRPLPDWVKPAS